MVDGDGGGDVDGGGNGGVHVDGGGGVHVDVYGDVGGMRVGMVLWRGCVGVDGAGGMTMGGSNLN